MPGKIIDVKLRNQSINCNLVFLDPDYRHFELMKIQLSEIDMSEIKNSKSIS